MKHASPIGGRSSKKGGNNMPPPPGIPRGGSRRHNQNNQNNSTSGQQHGNQSNYYNQHNAGATGGTSGSANSQNMNKNHQQHHGSSTTSGKDGGNYQQGGSTSSTTRGRTDSANSNGSSGSQGKGGHHQDWHMQQDHRYNNVNAGTNMTFGIPPPISNSGTRAPATMPLPDPSHNHQMTTSNQQHTSSASNTNSYQNYAGTTSTSNTLAPPTSGGAMSAATPGTAGGSSGGATGGPSPRPVVPDGGNEATGGNGTSGTAGTASSSSGAAVPSAPGGGESSSSSSGGAPVGGVQGTSAGGGGSSSSSAAAPPGSSTGNYNNTTGCTGGATSTSASAAGGPSGTAAPSATGLNITAYNKPSTRWADQGYQVGDFLGQGAMGTVFKCFRNGQTYAVKRIDLAKLRLRNNEQRLRQRLVREISILQTVGTHPNIVGYEGCYDEKESQLLFIVQEYVAGGELLAQIIERSFYDPEASWVLKGLAKGLKFLHDVHIAHRDLKPENVLISSSEDVGGHLTHMKLHNVKIADFGLSKEIATDSNPLQKSNILVYEQTHQSCVGTPMYVAPEVFDKRLEASFGVDIWACGVILFVMLEGKFPFKETLNTSERDYDTAFAQFKKRQSTPALQALRGMLKQDPKDRWSPQQIIDCGFCQIAETFLADIRQGRDTASAYAVIPSPGGDSGAEHEPDIIEDIIPAGENLAATYNTPGSSGGTPYNHGDSGGAGSAHQPPAQQLAVETRHTPKNVRALFDSVSGENSESTGNVMMIPAPISNAGEQHQSPQLKRQRVDPPGAPAQPSQRVHNNTTSSYNNQMNQVHTTKYLPDQHNGWATGGGASSSSTGGKGNKHHGGAHQQHNQQGGGGMYNLQPAGGGQGGQGGQQSDYLWGDWKSQQSQRVGVGGVAVGDQHNAGGQHHGGTSGAGGSSSSSSSAAPGAPGHHGAGAGGHNQHVAAGSGPSGGGKALQAQMSHTTNQWSQWNPSGGGGAPMMNQMNNMNMNNTTGAGTSVPSSQHVSPLQGPAGGASSSSNAHGGPMNPPNFHLLPMNNNQQQGPHGGGNNNSNKGPGVGGGNNNMMNMNSSNNNKGSDKKGKGKNKKGDDLKSNKRQRLPSTDQHAMPLSESEQNQQQQSQHMMHQQHQQQQQQMNMNNLAQQPSTVNRPSCHGQPMVIRENQQKRQFWGCHKYPHCTNTENPKVFCMFCATECRFRRKANGGFFVCPQIHCRFKKSINETAPVCKECQCQFMEIRRKQSTNAKFWGCLNYPYCKGSRPYNGTL
ncbi:unnamed protein product [Amoebophrya sp. A25]|nr:unnamed protein product [Amoebophrya sp. A25]|eukprot:GSA25T00009204001.1